MRIDLTLDEALALRSAAAVGTLDDTIDHIGWSAQKKRAYRRAEKKLSLVIVAQESTERF